MNTPWIIAILAAIVVFAILEKYAFAHPDRENTLSHFIAGMGASWPMSIALINLLVGILMSHFYWPWCANPLLPGGG